MWTRRRTGLRACVRCTHTDTHRSPSSPLCLPMPPVYAPLPLMFVFFVCVWSCLVHTPAATGAASGSSMPLSPTAGGGAGAPAGATSVTSPKVRFTDDSVGPPPPGAGGPLPVVDGVLVVPEQPREVRPAALLFTSFVSLVACVSTASNHSMCTAVKLS